MLRLLIATVSLAVFLAPASRAAIFTEEYFGWQRTSLEAVTLPETPIWEEYGFEEGERAVYAKDGASFTVTAWRFNDPTSAMAVFQWQQPSGYRPATVTKLAVESGDSFYMARGNYVLHFEGHKPTLEELQGLFLVLPRTDHSPLPILPDYLPRDGLIPDSVRFAIGPAGLQEFEPRLPLSTTAFQYGTEVQLGRYDTPSGPLDLAIIAYPTPHIARERLSAFRMLGNFLVKRTGPMLVVALDPSDPNAAQSLLGRVNYRATVTWQENMPAKQWSMVDLILSAGMLVGIALGFGVLGGLCIAGVRMLRQRMITGTTAADPMVMLHLEDK